MKKENTLGMTSEEKLKLRLHDVQEKINLFENEANLVCKYASSKWMGTREKARRFSKHLSKEIYEIISNEIQYQWTLYTINEYNRKDKKSVESFEMKLSNYFLMIEKLNDIYRNSMRKIIGESKIIKKNQILLQVNNIYIGNIHHLNMAKSLWKKAIKSMSCKE